MQSFFSIFHRAEEVCEITMNGKDKDRIPEQEIYQKKVILYGAGTQNLRMAYQPLQSAGCEVLAICDRDKKKQGKSYCGVKIISPKELEVLDAQLDSYLLVITIRTEAVIQEVRQSLQHLKNAEIFSFNDFIAYAKLNGHVKQFSCVMVHLVDDCNLNCVRCSHFSPLAPRGQSYLDVDEFEQDCAKLSALTAQNIEEIQLAGGEPMMHPKAYMFPYIIRKYFPNTQIVMITNGTYIMTMEEEFWESCRVNHVKIMLTKYPINLPYDKIEKMLYEKEIDLDFGNTGNNEKNEEKEMWGLPLCIEGGLDAQYNFDGCLCMQYIMRDGRMYPCANSAYIDLFNDYFGLHLPGPECNGVAFRNAKSLKEVTDAISKPVPLCAYCDARKRMPGIPWRTSERKLEEWILQEDENNL